MPMPRPRALALGLGLLIAGLLIGLWLGWRSAMRTRGWLDAVSRGHVLAEIAYGQYEEAGYEQAREGLEAYLAYLEGLLPRGEKWDPGESPLVGDSGIALDKALTLARLALLEEREHGDGAGDDLWAHAEGQAALAGWQDTSRENIRRFVERLDGTEPAAAAGADE